MHRALVFVLLMSCAHTMKSDAQQDDDSTTIAVIAGVAAVAMIWIVYVVMRDGPRK
jgi:uncharacterized protein YybS (DUF2232 family)